MRATSGDDSKFGKNVQGGAAIVPGKLICEVGVRPYELSSVTLGRFTPDNPPLGFSVEITPEPAPSDSVATQMVSLGTAEEYQLVLLVSNTGTQPIKARIEQLESLR